MQQPNVTPATSLRHRRGEGSCGERGQRFPIPAAAAPAPVTLQGAMGQNNLGSRQQSRRGKPWHQSPALPFLLAQGAPAAPGVSTNQPRHAPAFP